MKNLHRLLLTTALTAISFLSHGTNHDIYLADIEFSNGLPFLKNIMQITSSPDYDNQPHFSADSKTLYYTSQTNDQMDIKRYDLSSGTHSFLQNTEKSSEYSPTVMPNGKEISVIRVEEGGEQRLWALKEDGSSRLLLEDVKPVGYHYWTSNEDLILFVLGEKAHSLQYANINTGKSKTLLFNLGMTFGKFPGKQMYSFTHPVGDVNYLFQFDPSESMSTPVIKMPENTNYYAWHPQGGMFVTTGNFVKFNSNVSAGSKWHDAKVEFACSKGLTRIAISPSGKKAAVVCGD